MTEKIIKYKADGRDYDVYESEVSKFLETYPNATIRASVDDRNYDVFPSEMEDFLKVYPNASYTVDNPSSAITDTNYEPTLPDADEDAPEMSRRERRQARREERREARRNDDATSIWETIGKGTGAAAVGTAKLALDLGRMAWRNSVLGKFAGGDFDDELQDESNPLTRASIKLGEVQERLSREADPTGGEKGFLDLLSEGKVGKAFQKALGSGIESLPMMLSAGTGIGAFLYGAAMAAGSYADETRENPDIPAWKRGINSAGSALLEMAVEKIGGPLKNLGGKAGKEVTEEMAQEILRKVAKEGPETIGKRILRVLGKTGKEGLEEGGEEFLTSFGNDALGEALDLIDGDKDYGIRAQWEQMKEQNPDADLGDFALSKGKEYLDAFLGGALSGMQISGTTNIVSEGAKFKYDNDSRKILDEARAIGSSLDYGDMYDSDDTVREQIDAVAATFTDEKGEASISGEFIGTLSSEDAFALSRRNDFTPAQRNALFGLARAKAIQEGLTTKFDERLESQVNAERILIEEVTEYGVVITAMHGGKPVYVMGAWNKGDGTVTAPGGQNGPVIVVDAMTGEKSYVRSEDIQFAESKNPTDYAAEVENMLRQNDARNRQVAKSTMSVRAKAKAVKPFAGKKILVDVGNGLTEVLVQQISPNGDVIIKGKKGDLGGQSVMTLSAGAFYDSIYRDEDGNPVITEAPQEAEAETPQEESPVAEVTGNEDYRGQTISILLNGVPTEVEVMSQDNPSDSIVYEYTDASGNRRTASSTIGAFNAAIQQAAEYVAPTPTAEETPSVETVPADSETQAPQEVPVTPENIDWDALFEQDPEAYFVELQNQFGEEALDILNDEVVAAQEELDSLSKKRGKTQNERLENRQKKVALQNRIAALNGMITRLTPAAAPIAETPVTPETAEMPVSETPATETPAEVTPTEQPAAPPETAPAVAETAPVTETPAVPESTEPAPVEQTPVAETPAETVAEPEPAPVTTESTPVAPNPVDNPAREAQKREKALAQQLQRYGISPEQKSDMAFNAGKAVGDFFATREEYDAYAENATDLGDYNADFERGVDASFANRQQNVGNSPVNSVPLETEPNGENNGEVTPRQGEVSEGHIDRTGNEPLNDEETENSSKEPSEGAEEVSGSEVHLGGLRIDKYPVRKGNVTRQTLADTFGLNTVSPALNQEVINSVYDFMMEMSKMLGISPKSIGHGATLGVKTMRDNSRARAQYSFKHRNDGTIFDAYLNFKNSKLSSIAHEWFHSLDQALSYYETGKGKRSATNAIAGEFAGRKETLDAIKGILKAINKSGHKERLKKELWFDKAFLRYSLRKDEMTARAFEEYIRMKFAEAGIEVEGLSENATNHPTSDEMAVIAPAFDNLFKVLQEKEGKAPGTSVLYHIGEMMEEDSPAKRLATEAVLTALDDNGIDVVKATDEQTQQMLDVMEEVAEMQKGTAPETASVQEEHHPTVVSSADGAKVINNTDILQTPNGTVYGWTDGKKIYLTEAGINPNTPIHEYTHLWAKAMMQKNPKGWSSIKKLLKGTPVWNQVMNDPNYSSIHNDEDAVASEALSRISGTENAAKMEQMAQQMIDEAKGTARKLEARGLVQNMRDALNKFWKWVGTNLFGIEKFESVEQVTDRVLFDLLNNTDLDTLSEGQVQTQIVTKPKESENSGFSPSEIAAMETPVLSSKGTFNNLSEAEAWAKSNLQGKSYVNKFTQETISISGKSIKEMLNPNTTKKINEGVHMAALMSVPDFIETGIPAEQHADTHGRGFDVIRLYNAIEIDGKVYRVKSTVKRLKEGDRYYTYEIQEMELIEDTQSTAVGSNGNPVLNSTNSMTGANLLKGVRKTNSSELILEEDSSFADGLLTSEVDADYLAAVERGDMETAQRMVLEAARLAMPNTKVVDKKGNPKVVYHGTKGKFNTFAYSREDIGFHFGTKGTARTRIGRGKDARIMQVFLNLENPLIFDEDLGSWDADYIVKDLLKKEMMSYDDAKAILLTPNGYKRNSASALVEVRRWMSENGYDGAIYPNWYESDGKDSYIAFNRSQIKSAEPVTYDNNGNVIPLSERFNPLNPDIRYRGSENNSLSSQSYEGTGEYNTASDGRGEGVQEELPVLRPALLLGAGSVDGEVSQADFSRFNPISKRDGESDRQRNNRENKFLSFFNRLTSEEQTNLYIFLKDYSSSPSGILRGRATDFINSIRQKGNNDFADFVEDFINDELKYREGVSSAAVARHGLLVGVDQNLNALERMFYAFNKDQYNGVLFGRVLKLAKRFGVTVKFATRNADGSFISEYGSYNPNDNSITLDANLLAKGNESELCQTILHELIHSVVARAASIMTGRAVDKNNQFIDPQSLPKDVVDGINTLKEVYEAIKDDGTFQDTYGKKDFEEMLSEITDPKFRGLLKAKKLWKKFLNGICKLLGIADESSSESDALTEIESAIDNILSAAERGELDSAYASYLGQLADGYTLADLQRLGSGPVKTLLTQNVLFRTWIDKEAARASARDAFDEAAFVSFQAIVDSISNATGFKGKAKAVRTGFIKTWNEYQMEHQDSQQYVIAGMEAIMQETGNTPIEDYENYLFFQNQMQSRSAEEIETYLDRYYKPIIAQINAIVTQILKSRGIKETNRAERMKVYAEVKQYLIAKHGLERNKLYQTTKTRNLNIGERTREINNAQKIYDDKVNQINMDTSLTDTERQLQLRDALDEYNATLEEINTRQVPDIRDYSGLTALFGLDAKEYREAERLAQELVDNFENEVSTDELWAKINAATNKTLRHSYECGLLSRSQYEQIRDMFQYYIPLRGFDETTAEDVYSYSRFEGNSFSPAVKKAKGRTSVANDPIAYIITMATSEIIQGNHNKEKQALYHFVANRPNSLLSIRDCWYVKDPVTGNYIETYPDIAGGETWEDFESKMETLAKSKSAIKRKKGLDVGYRFQKPANKNLHYIHVMINGVERAIVVNGNPRLAEGVNGIEDSKHKDLIKQVKRVNRVASQLFTNYNYKFGGKNFIRDFLFAQTMMLIDESPMYNLRFAANWFKYNPFTIGSLMRKYRKGTLDLSIEGHRLFKEFIENGGKTGYVFIDELEKQKDRINAAVERMSEVGNATTNGVTKARVLLEVISYVNECIELAARFGTYATSRQTKDKSGKERSIMRSIDDAKNVTTNFNRKGAQSGRGFIGGLAAFMGSWNFFYNAAVQGVQRVWSSARKRPVKSAIFWGGWIALGYLMPYIIDIFRGDDDEEEDIYWNLPEYERKNNICMPFGKGKVTATISLSPQIRECYAIGVTLSDATFNKSVDKDATALSMEVASLLAKAFLPANPLEGLSSGLTPAENLIMFGTPDIADPIVEAVINKDWTGAPIEYRTTYNEGAPHYTKVIGKDDWKKSVGEKLYKLGEDNLDSSMDWNLSAWEHVIKGGSGGLGVLFKDISNVVHWVTSWEAPERLNDIPVARTFLSSNAMDDEKFVNNIYWDMDKIYQKKMQTISKVYGLTPTEVFKDKKGKGNANLVKVYEAKAYPFLEEYYKLNNKISKKYRDIRNMPEDTEAQKKAKVIEEQKLFNMKRDLVYKLLEYEIE